MKKLLITGIFRSGTTFLTRMISAHKDMLATYQPITPFLRLARNKFIVDSLKQSIKNKPMGINYFTNSEEKIFNESILQLKFNNEEINNLQEQLYTNLSVEKNEKPQFLCNQFEDMKENDFRTLINYFYKKQEIFNPTKTVIGIKEVWAEEFFLPLLKSSEEMNIIHIFRDPRAIYSSRNTGNYLKSCDNKKYPLLFFILSWKRSFNYMNKCKGYNNYMYVTYEDMILNIKKVAKKICLNLSVQFDIDMINPKIYLDGEGNKWKANSTSKKVDFIDRNFVDNWKTKLTEQEIGIIEYLCQNEFKELGYERITNFNKEDFLDYEEEDKDIIDWLQIDQLKLSNENKLKLIKEIELK